MGKQETSKRFFLFRFPFLIFILGIGAAGWLFWPEIEPWKDNLQQYIENKEVVTLESKYTPQQIMDLHRDELIGFSQKRTFQDPSMRYYPYLLLDIKYTEGKKSREGMLLWGMVDGEIVINTDTWETTNGFKDCIDCQASRSDFKVIQALAKHQGTMSIEELQNDLQIERDLLDSWLEEAKRKHLILQHGNKIQFHFENPMFLVSPDTHFNKHLVSKPIQNGYKVPKNYSRNQLVTIAKAAFGNEMKIRSEKEIFLPGFAIGVVNADGSVHVSEWNAITGHKIVN